jgi:hypothetical protein
MSQEETKENLTANESASDLPEENLDTEESPTVLSEPVNSEEIDNLPIESIGSYARLEELLTDEEAENACNPTSQS